MSEQYVPSGQVGGHAVEQYFCPPIEVQVPIVQGLSSLHGAPIVPGAASCFEPPPDVAPPPGPPPPESPIMLPRAHAAITAAMTPPSRTARPTRREPIRILQARRFVRRETKR